MDMRVRIPELLKSSGLTPYALAKRSGDRISLSTAYRLTRSKGRLNTFDAEVLEALCDIFGVGPGELLERDDGKGKRGR
jgi:DNA-binding Xre family transcriptional regulator